METRVYKEKKWLNQGLGVQVMRFRRSKKLAKKLWKNQSNSCNNEVLNLGCLQLPVFGLVKDVLRLYLLTYCWLSWEVDKQLRRLSSFERAHRAFNLTKLAHAGPTSSYNIALIRMPRPGIEVNKCYFGKKLFHWSRKTFEIRDWRLRICKIF